MFCTGQSRNHLAARHLYERSIFLLAQPVGACHGRASSLSASVHPAWTCKLLLDQRLFSVAPGQTSRNLRSILECQISPYGEASAHSGWPVPDCAASLQPVIS